MDIITTGKTTNTKLKISKIVEIAKQILMANVTKYKKNTNMDKLIPQVEKILKQSIKNDEMVEALKQLEIADYIALTGQNKHNPQFRIQRDDPY